MNAAAESSTRPLVSGAHFLSLQGATDEPLATTDASVYRQPASDVPVPSIWRQAPTSAPALPGHGTEPAPERPDTQHGRAGTACDDDESAVGWHPTSAVLRSSAVSVGTMLASALVGCVLLALAVDLSGSMPNLDERGPVQTVSAR